MTDRIVSLAPSATATLCTLGGAPAEPSVDDTHVGDASAGDALVGVTHHCEPTGAAEPPGERASGGDTPTGDPPTVVGGWPDPDLDAVAALEPDVVLTCDALQRETAESLRGRGLRVAHAEPTRLADVFEYVEGVGDAVGRPAEGARLAATLRRRVERVRRAVPSASDGRPVVYAEEWADPPMAAGNWVPEAVAAAGGRCPFVGPGERSRAVEPAEVESADPDHVILHPCGRGDRGDPAAFAERGWALDAAVHPVDDSLLNQPSPRLVEGIETLAALLHGVEIE